MGKIRIDIEDIRQIQEEINRINKLDLSNIKLYCGNDRVEISQEKIDKFKFIGLNNFHFFSESFYD